MAGTIAGAAPPRVKFSSGYKGFVLGLLLLCYAFNFIDRTIISTIGPKIREDLHLTNTQLGLLGGLYFALLYTILGVPIARLAERWNRVRIISVALVVWSGFTALCGTAANFATLAGLRFGVGIGEAGCSPPSHSLISDYYEPSKRASALSIYSLGIPLGTMFGAAAGGFIAQTWGWRAAFMAVGMPGIILAIVAWLFVKEPPRGNSEVEEHPALAEDVVAQPVRGGLMHEFREIGAVIKVLFTKWPLLNMTLGVTLASFGGYGAGAFVPQYFYTTFPLSLALVGLLVGLIMSGASSGLGTIVGGFLSDYLSKRSKAWYALTPAFGLMIALPIYLLAFTRTDWKLAFFILLFPGIFHYTYLGPSFAVVQNAVPARRRATATAVLFFFLNLIALGGGPTFTGSLVDSYAVANFAHPGIDIFTPLGPALSKAFGDTAMSYVHIFTGLLDMAKGVIAHAPPAPAAGSYAATCPGGVAPKGASAATALLCKGAISKASQAGILITGFFYWWASIHYFLAAIGMAKQMNRKVE